MHVYVNLLHPQNTDANLVAFKFAFLRILTDHEYYVQLNSKHLDIIIYLLGSVSECWCAVHFITGNRN